MNDQNCYTDRKTGEREEKERKKERKRQRKRERVRRRDTFVGILAEGNVITI